MSTISTNPDSSMILTHGDCGPFVTSGLDNSARSYKKCEAMAVIYKQADRLKLTTSEK